MKRSTGFAALAVIGVVATTFMASLVWACGSSCGAATDHSRHDSQKRPAAPQAPQGSSLHGGQVSSTANHHFETVFAPDGIRIYAYTAEESPLMVEKASGTVVLEYADGTSERLPLLREQPASEERSVHFCPMHPEVVRIEPGTCSKCGGMKLYVQDRLVARKDLSAEGDRFFKAVVSIRGLPGTEENVTFTTAFGEQPKARGEDSPVRNAPEEPAHSHH